VEKLKALGYRLASLFTHKELVVDWRPEGKGRAKVRSFRRGLAVFMTVPLIAGAAFEVLQLDTGAAIAAAAGTSTFELGEVPMTEAEQGWTVNRVTVTASALVTGVNTNSGTINVRQLRGGVAQQTIASIALVAGTNLPAETPVVIPITGSPNVQSGDLLDVQYVQIGTGLALPANCVVKVEMS